MSIDTFTQDSKLFTNISNLKNWDRNPRAIKKEDFERLKRQIKEHDIYKPLLITSDGTVLGGNMRFKAYKEIGMEQVWVSIVDPKTEAEKLKYALSDNDRVGYYVDQDLAELIQEYGVEINLEDYKVDLGQALSLADVLNQFAPDVEEDEAPAVAEGEPDSKLGEVYQLGRHRLVCGDATKIEDVEKLMDGQKADMVFTDPPYGVSYGDKNKFLNAIAPGNRIQENLDNDTLSVVKMKELWIGAFTNMAVVSKAGGSYYVCSPQGGELMMMMMSLLEAGWDLRQSIIWAKNNHVLGRSDYHYKHEPLLYGWRDGAGHKFYGPPGETTLWEIPKPHKSDLHPTMKPIALMARAINNSSKQDDIILDLFGGSGSTLIACEQTNRICYMAEIDPKYVDVIRKRYDNYVNNRKEAGNG
uniref:Putative methyltransferase n=1 Tax=viral metagenome TaxID=1070528 RepID=A0A6M3JVP2_9ZZZZ